ncbi:protein of unknown function DUF72 [Methylorubrum extorquens DSM 13060]|uniref:DUF72 domain-containing protein n=1 Tax=Methylorubrum extorquens DSM 13060 TaxID=882800 RepID=H1KR95_METEX|nr:protein of unknown function DUF72 [Methylorubrum extorquens DSM 13060]
MELLSVTAVGTAGWNVPRAYADRFPQTGSHLERYAQRFNAVEINTSFYRPHRVATYERWAAAVPERFRFAVKVPRTITHERRLENVDEPLARFFDEIAGLGLKLGPLLLQLPPSLPFQSGTSGEFLQRFRRTFSGSIVCEPRHPSWFTPSVNTLLRCSWTVAEHRRRTRASPAREAQAGQPEARTPPARRSHRLPPVPASPGRGHPRPCCRLAAPRGVPRRSAPREVGPEQSAGRASRDRLRPSSQPLRRCCADSRQDRAVHPRHTIGAASATADTLPALERPLHRLLAHPTRFERVTFA